MKNNGKKVFVGMSGGVDSSVSAALLKQAGFDVTGVFIKVWQPDWLECNWREERIEAMRTAAHLGIKFETLDLEKEYKRDVIDYMIAEYRAGRTPNPDVMCNRYVKFGAFWDWAKTRNADFIATGHYAIRRPKDGERSWELGVGADTNKDQSYFLWTLTQNDLEHILFPVGHLQKSEVRDLARKFKLPNAEKKDSQGLCFIGKVDVKEFLSHYIQARPGQVLNEKGDVIGSHSGSELLTIGERHGFVVDPKFKTPDDKPLYVIKKNIEANTVTVGKRTLSDLRDTNQKTVQLINTNWISCKLPDSDKLLKARSRYRQELQDIRISNFESGTATAEFDQSHETLTPGQSLVIYDGEVCVGGGIIN